MGENERWVQLPMHLTPSRLIASVPTPYPKMSNKTAKHLFCRLAEIAVEQGLVTTGACDTIRRYDTRKAGNWVRHLRNLCAYLADKQERV